MNAFKQPDDLRLDDLFAGDEESALVSKSVVKSEYSNISAALPTTKPGLCMKCNYFKEGISLLTCSECSNSWHVQCLDSCEAACKNGVSEKQWRCQSCVRCTHCHSMVGSLLLRCRCCNSPYHFDCLEPSFKSQVPLTSTDDLNAEKIEFKCQVCVKCDGCGSKVAGK